MNFDCLLTKVFQPVTLHDISLIKKYLAKTTYEESNHNIITMFTWMDMYPLYKYVDENYMLVASVHNGEAFIYMPLCAKEYFIEATNKAHELFNECEIPFSISCVIKEYKDLLLTANDKYQVEDIRDGYDYVYKLENFKGFKGKKMQKKRNHLNNFLKLYADRYAYEDLNAENREEVKEYILSLEAQSDTLIVERAGILQVLDAYEVLDYKAGIIKIDGKIEGFILASPLSDRMIQENVEKANHEVIGLSQALLSEFFKRNFSDYIYLNREDDMGIEKLRESKLSYHPEYLIEKYSLNL